MIKNTSSNKNPRVMFLLDGTCDVSEACYFLPCLSLELQVLETSLFEMGLTAPIGKYQRVALVCNN